MGEIVDMVDEEDKVVRQVSRKEANEKVLRIRSSRIMILNSKGEILVHRRASSKKRFPDHWDLGVAETVKAGEDYEEGAVRGMMEEMGIEVSASDLKLLSKFMYEDTITKRWYTLFSFIYDGPVKIDEEEVAEARFVSREELDNMLKKEKFVPVVHKMIKMIS